MMLPVPHQKQKEILADQHAVVAVAAGRRSSKTTTAKLAAIEASVFFDRWIARRGHKGLILPSFQQTYVAILAPTRQHVKSLYWQFLTDLFNRQPYKRLVRDINSTAMTIDLLGNRPSIILSGSNHEEGARLLGLKMVKVVADECQHMTWATYQETIRPALADSPGSQFLGYGTARRGQNTLRRLRDQATEQPDLVSFQTFTSYDNPYFDNQAIDRERLLLPPEIFNREFLCSFDEPDNATIFSALDADNLTTNIGESDLPAHLRLKVQIPLHVMGVDFGSRNPACAVFAYVPETKQFTYVDGWASPNRVIREADQIVIMRRFIDRYNVKTVRCDPSRPDAILTLADALKEQAVVSAGYNAVTEGTDQVHALLHQKKLRFLTGHPTLIAECDGGISGQKAYQIMADYRYKVDKDGTILTVEAPGRWEIPDCCRYALAYDRIASFEAKRHERYIANLNRQLNRIATY